MIKESKKPEKTKQPKGFWEQITLKTDSLEIVQISSIILMKAS